MGGAASHDDAANCGAARVARLIGATEDADVVLLRTLVAGGVGVVAERRATVLDTLLQDLTDCRMQC